MIINLNVGILGHVDSGKTTIAKSLSHISSTAAFDKNPQSQERGITLDLGFSAYQCSIPDHLQHIAPSDALLQLTFVDCPGHAKLIRTIIGGAQIIDLMLLVIDINKGIQTQTVECLTIGEICKKRLIVALNKIDLVEPQKREKFIEKFSKKLRTILGSEFGQDISIIPVSATCNENLQELLQSLTRHATIPDSNLSLPFVFAVDHCFSIRGQGTICTGTVLQGVVKLNDNVEISTTDAIRETRRVKSIQMFRQPMDSANQGDRIGLCITQFDSKTLERGIIASPGHASFVTAGIIELNKIKYFKETITSNNKYHLSIGYETVMGKVTMFKSGAQNTFHEFDWSHQYEFLPELADNLYASDHMLGESARIFALLQFDKPIIVFHGSLVIASKLDINIDSNQCRLAFWGKLNEICVYNRITTFNINNLKVFRNKSKTGTIQRLVNQNEVIVDRLFEKNSNRELFVGLKVQFSTGEVGIMESTFGSTSKVKVRILGDGLTNETMARLQNKNNIDNQVIVTLTYKKLMYNQETNKKIIQ